MEAVVVVAKELRVDLMAETLLVEAVVVAEAGLMIGSRGPRNLISGAGRQFLTSLALRVL